MPGKRPDRAGRFAPDNAGGPAGFFPPREKGTAGSCCALSVHDPIMPLNMESNVAGGVKVIAQKLQAFLLTCKGLDDKPMADFLAK